MENISSFMHILHTDGPHADYAPELDLYTFLVGKWDTEVIAYEESGAIYRNKGEIHAGWVLEGRAIQDVWIVPKRSERKSPLKQLPVTGSWYGTTLRVYDPKLKIWHIIWTDPATMFMSRQIGRASNGAIIQEGKTETGQILRWSFTEIQPNAFHWLGEISMDEGKSWRKQVDVFARRNKD